MPKEPGFDPRYVGIQCATRARGASDTRDEPGRSTGTWSSRRWQLHSGGRWRNPEQASISDCPRPGCHSEVEPAFGASERLRWWESQGGEADTCQILGTCGKDPSEDAERHEHDQ